VTLRSGSYADFRQVFTPRYRRACQSRRRSAIPDRRGTLSGGGGGPHDRRLPEANEGCGSRRSFAERVRDADYDSFSAPGPEQAAVVGSRTGPPPASGVADAFAALHFLAGHPRIDADRIGIDGSRSAARWRT